MPSLFRKIVERLQALLLADAAAGLEAEFHARHADRKAELIEKARRLGEQGHEDLAGELRAEAERLSTERPLASALPMAGHLAGQCSDTDSPIPEVPRSERAALSAGNGSSHRTLPVKPTRKARPR